MARNDLKALREMIAEAQHILTTVNLPEGRASGIAGMMLWIDALGLIVIVTSPITVFFIVRWLKGGSKTRSTQF